MSEHEPTPVHTTIDDQALDPAPAPRPADPRRSTTHVMRGGQLPGRSAFLAWPAASSMVFLLSAACLLGGAWSVFVNLGIDPERIAERLGMVGTVHLYELALVGVALLLCRFQRANPDAIGPVILGACFLVGAAVTLDLVSIDAPKLALAAGVVGLGLAVAKATVLAQLGGGASAPLLLGALALLVAWNLLWPAVMGLYLFYSKSGLASTAWWMPGWVVLVLATTVLVVGILRDDSVGVERLRPFLRRATLRWVLGLAIAGCSAVHLLVLGYLHSLDVTLGEVLPVFALLCLGAVDLRHRAACAAPLLDRVVLASPCAVALVVVLAGEHGVMSNPHAAGVVFTPALVLIAYGAAIWGLAMHRRQAEWRWIAEASLVFGVLVWGGHTSALTFHWSLAALMIAGGVALRAFSRGRSETLAQALTVMALIGVLQPEAIRWQLAHGLSPLGTALITSGGVVLAVLLASDSPRRAGVRLALWLVMAGTVTLCARQGVLSLAASVGGILLLTVHVLAWWRTRDRWVFASLSVPAVLAAPLLIPTHKGWLAVVAAFALLAAGVRLSWLRVRAVQERRGVAGNVPAASPSV